MAISMFGSRVRPLGVGLTVALATAGSVAAMAASSAGAHGTATGHAATAGCATSALRVSLGRGDGTLGSIYYPLKFKNVSDRACTLRGYPGVSAITTAGKQIGAPATRSGNPFTTVRPNPGRQRHATLRVEDTGAFTKSRCKPRTAAALRIYPPNQTRSLRLAVGFTVCSKPALPSMEILPVK